jgi:hypothetical protein
LCGKRPARIVWWKGRRTRLCDSCRLKADEAGELSPTGRRVDDGPALQNVAPPRLSPVQKMILEALKEGATLERRIWTETGASGSYVSMHRREQVVLRAQNGAVHVISNDTVKRLERRELVTVTKVQEDDFIGDAVRGLQKGDDAAVDRTIVAATRKG